MVHPGDSHQLGERQRRHGELVARQQWPDRRPGGVHPCHPLTLPALGLARPPAHVEPVQPHPLGREVVLVDPPGRELVGTDADLLEQLARRGLGRALARLDLAPGKLPEAGRVLAGLAFCEQHAPVGRAEHAHRHVDHGTTEERKTAGGQHQSGQTGSGYSPPGRRRACVGPGLRVHLPGLRRRGRVATGIPGRSFLGDGFALGAEQLGVVLRLRGAHGWRGRPRRARPGPSSSGPGSRGWPGGVWRGSCQAASKVAIASARAANSRASASTAAPSEPYTVTVTCVRVKLRSG